MGLRGLCGRRPAPSRPHPNLAPPRVAPLLPAGQSREVAVTLAPLVRLSQAPTGGVLTRDSWRWRQRDKQNEEGAGPGWVGEAALDEETANQAPMGA